MLMTVRGCSCRTNSFTTLLMQMRMRMTLMPPPVLPAQAPIAMMRRVGVQKALPQATKSQYGPANPVLDMMVLTWNSEARNVSSPAGGRLPAAERGVGAKQNSSTKQSKAQDQMPRKPRSSSFFHSTLGRRILI